MTPEQEADFAELDWKVARTIKHLRECAFIWEAATSFQIGLVTINTLNGWTYDWRWIDFLAVTFNAVFSIFNFAMSRRFRRRLAIARALRRDFRRAFEAIDQRNVAALDALADQIDGHFAKLKSLY